VNGIDLRSRRAEEFFNDEPEARIRRYSKWENKIIKDVLRRLEQKRAIQL
jgi:hypothetical protein